MKSVHRHLHDAAVRMPGLDQQPPKANRDAEVASPCLCLCADDSPRKTPQRSAACLCLCADAV